MASQSFPVSISQVRKYLLHHSLLGQETHTLNQVFDHFCSIQVDPIDTVAPSHELVLFNRVPSFTSQQLNKELYQTRSLFEYWLQLYSIIPTKFYPYLQIRRNLQDPWHKQFAREHATALNLVRIHIKEHGPTSSFDLTHIPTNSISPFTWNNANTNTALLEFLWDRGEILVHHRQNRRKYYDLAHRLISVTQIVSPQKSRAWILESFFRYFGIIKPSHLRRIGYTRNLGLDKLFLEYLRTGKIIELKISDLKTKYYILNSQIQYIESKLEMAQTINILSPLDPLILDRKMLAEIFNFHYIWEAYIPPDKRKFGFYGMPVIYKGEFKGQLELKKTQGKLIIKNSQITDPSSAFRNSLAREIDRLEEFVFTR